MKSCVRLLERSSTQKRWLNYFLGYQRRAWKATAGRVARLANPAINKSRILLLVAGAVAVFTACYVLMSWLDDPDSVELVDKPLPELITDLSSWSVATRRNAAFTILNSRMSIKFPNPELRQALRKRLSDSDLPTASWAASMLCEFPDPPEDDLFPFCSKLLSHDSWWFRDEGASQLGYLKSSSARCLPLLIKALADEDRRVGISAARSLAEFGPKAAPAIPQLIRVVRGRPESRDLLPMYAAEALGKIGPQAAEALPDLIRELDTDYRDSDRPSFARAIGEIGTDAAVEAIPVLVKATKDQHGYLRQMAAVALGRIRARPEQSIPSLMRMIEDEDNVAACRAIEALERFGADARPAVPLLVEALDRHLTAIAAARALGVIGVRDELVITALQKAAQDKDELLHAEAKKALDALTGAEVRDKKRS